MDEPAKESAPINDAAPQVDMRPPELDASKLLAEVQPQSDTKVGAGLSSLEQLSNFPKTALLGGPDKGLANEAKDLAKTLPFSNAMRFMTKSA